MIYNVLYVFISPKATETKSRNMKLKVGRDLIETLTSRQLKVPSNRHIHSTMTLAKRKTQIHGNKIKQQHQQNENGGSFGIEKKLLKMK